MNHSSGCGEVDALNVNAQIVLEKIGRAFGTDEDCLGIIAVSDVPNFSELRQRVLPMAWQLAHLSAQDLENITKPDACYSVGWSHGQEKLAGPDGPPDLAKGSFYANPFTDDLLQELKQRRRNQSNGASPTTLLGCQLEDESENTLDRLAEANPAFFAPNVWPSNSLPQLESALKELGQLIGKVGSLLARPCDIFVLQQVCENQLSSSLPVLLKHSRFFLYYVVPDVLQGKIRTYLVQISIC